LLVGGGTPAYEAMLEKKRAALRQALRHEYIKTLYNPDLVIINDHSNTRQPISIRKTELFRVPFLNGSSIQNPEQNLNTKPKSEKSFFIYTMVYSRLTIQKLDKKLHG
jgi:hypothetical protein